MRRIRLETGRNFLMITETDREMDREMDRDGARWTRDIDARHGARRSDMGARYGRDAGRAD
jgi:hypothetical protein